MRQMNRFVRGMAFAAAMAAPLAVQATDTVQEFCAARTKGTYGFQCHGSTTVSPAGLEQVTFLGTVSGSSAGRFTGTGTFNSSLGSLRQRVVGDADFADRTCAGRISYTVYVLGPNGEILFPLPDKLDINFVTVDGGREILGAPYSPAGTGAAVPRMVCRLIRVGGGH